MASDVQPLEGLQYVYSLVHAGVDPSLPGNGGIECYNYLTVNQRLADTFSYLLCLFLCVLPIALRKVRAVQGSYNKLDHSKKDVDSEQGKKILLVALCLTFGIELGYKISTRQLIYLLNPCHIVTALQIYFLMAKESATMHVLFRLHIHLLFGAFLAIILPVVNTRILPGEVATYWIQHVLIFFIVPPYLIHKGGCFTPEPLDDYSMAFLALIVFATHMFVVLQAIGMMTLVNLNNMLCPAVSDPFQGPYYRWFAIIHQSILTLFFGKVYTFVVKKCLKKIQGKDIPIKTE